MKKTLFWGSLLFLVVMIAVFVISYVQGNNISDNEFEWRLTGREILVEMMDPSGNKDNGIYAIDPFAENIEPKLLIKNGHKPEWSPNHKFFVYIEGISLWMAQIDGSVLRISNGAISEININSYDPPVRWLQNGGYAIKYNFESLGTAIYPTSSIFNPPTDLKNLNTQVFIPPMRHWKEPPVGAKLKWNDIQAVRNVDMSPDGKHYVLQVAPLAPMDVRNNESKIYINDRAYNEDEVLKGWYTSVGMIKNPPRRLTNLNDNICEINPMWSPDGEWIAFTVIHLDDGYMAPAVCKPDGTGYTELLPENSSQYNSSMWPTDKKWYPASSWDKIITTPDIVNSEFRWGNPYAFAVEWSRDGKYLLLNAGDRFTTLVMAKNENGKWLLSSMASISGSRESMAGIYYAVLGGNTSDDSCWVAFSDRINTQLFNVATNQHKILSQGGNMIIRWLDW